MTLESEPRSSASRSLATLRAETDDAVRRLTVIHQSRLACRRGCHECCVDDITVFQIEADAILRQYAALLAQARPHPVGACAFLDAEGACRIYQARPYVCRTQGLPLRWVEEGNDGEWVEYRDICQLNEAGPALEELHGDQCWTLGQVEGKLAALQRATYGKLQRVSLRALLTTE